MLVVSGRIFIMIMLYNIFNILFISIIVKWGKFYILGFYVGIFLLVKCLIFYYMQLLGCVLARFRREGMIFVFQRLEFYVNKYLLFIVVIVLMEIYTYSEVEDIGKKEGLGLLGCSRKGFIQRQFWSYYLKYVQEFFKRIW